MKTKGNIYKDTLITDTGATNVHGPASLIEDRDLWRSMVMSWSHPPQVKFDSINSCGSCPKLRPDVVSKLPLSVYNIPTPKPGPHDDDDDDDDDRDDDNDYDNGGGYGSAAVDNINNDNEMKRKLLIALKR
ncbi:hypothetical protein ElyMa_000726800 [Elysia marginata]|uniref:Uncharacterized protein n=1 Tax=Elysia marginata TaxID=1093978 RepID=A0AAV4GQR7_9GAST|nr:hypothetical protein ElyMa_000726800 [Elysia marginata]